MRRTKYRRYRLERNALKYAAKMTRQLADVNRRRIDKDSRLSHIDGFYVDLEPNGFAFVVWTLFSDGSRALTA